MVEKEFNVGAITDEFLVMKFLNLFDEYNIQKYNDSSKNAGKGEKPLTIGG